MSSRGAAYFRRYRLGELRSGTSGRQAVPWDAVFARLGIGGIVRNAFIGVGADFGNVLGNRRLGGVGSRHNRAARDDFVALRPDHTEALELAAGSARDIDRRTQEKCAIGDFRADFIMR